MAENFVVREISLLVFCSLGWAVGYIQHRFPNSNDNINVPSILAVTFGNFQTNVLSLGGMLLQILALIIFITVTLYNLQIIARSNMIGLIVLIAAILAIVKGLSFGLPK